jgi:hypothetical protein
MRYFVKKYTWHRTKDEFQTAAYEELKPYFNRFEDLNLANNFVHQLDGQCFLLKPRDDFILVRDQKA